MVSEAQMRAAAMENMAALAEERETPHAYLFLGSGKPVFGSHWVFVKVAKSSYLVTETFISCETSCRAEMKKALYEGCRSEML